VATIKYSDLLPEVLPHLAADPSNPMTEAALRNAVIEFCKDSWIWRHYPDAIDVTAGESTYELEPPAGADVSAVLLAKFDGETITPQSTDQIDVLYPQWRTQAGTVKHFVQVDTETIILVPLPDVTLTSGLELVLALHPRRSAISFPRWITSQYMEQIAAGAIGRLMMMPDKAWSNQKTGAGYLGVFRNAIDVARAAGVSGLSRAVVRTTSQH
jgi:hypothetical protein